jgi:hypothetical protein
MIETTIALSACLLVLIVAVVHDRRPYRPGKRNYIPIMNSSWPPDWANGR